MWRPVLLPWPELPEHRRSHLRAVIDEVVVDAEGQGYVVVDERCPGIDVDTLRSLVEAARDGRPRVGVRPVTDTVKRVRDHVVAGTVDRAGLVQLASPLVVPERCRTLLGAVTSGSLVEMAQRLASATDVGLVEVPVAARRLADAEELTLLEG